MSSKRRLSHSITSSANKLRLDSLNKILKIDSNKKKVHKREAAVRQLSRVALADLLKDTSSTRVQPLPDFKSFLANKDNVQVFRQFLKQQYCHENIDFYLACERYRKLEPDKAGKDLTKFIATQIFNDYLSEKARQPVNIDYACLQNIIKNMKEPKADLFCEAQNEIYDLMKSDCYPRFCKTWQLDRNTARKILSEKGATSTQLNSTNCSAATISFATVNETTSTLNSTTTTSVSSRCAKRKLVLRSNSECPLDCPYYRIGLPCQQHNLDENSRVEPGGSSDFIDKIDLSRMHHVPNCCARRTPPPPPLPPRPEEINYSPVLNKKFCPYVGKVFDV